MKPQCLATPELASIIHLRLFPVGRPQHPPDGENGPYLTSRGYAANLDGRRNATPQERKHWEDISAILRAYFVLVVRWEVVYGGHIPKL